MIIYNDESLNEFLGEKNKEPKYLLQCSDGELKELCDKAWISPNHRLIDNFGGVDSAEQKQPRFGDNIVIVKGKKYKRRIPFGIGKQGESDAEYNIMINKVDGDYFLLNHVIYKGEVIYV